MSKEKVQLKMVSIEDLEFQPDNPRLVMYDEELEELSESLARDGLIQPIVVRPSKDRYGKYEIVAGERRVRAAVKKNISSLPAIIREELTDEEASRFRLIENMKRKDLNLVEKVHGIRAHIRMFNLTLEDVAKELGYTPATIRSWFNEVDKLSPNIKSDVGFIRRLSADNLRLLGKYNHGTQEKLAKVIIEHKLTDWTARRFQDFFEANPEGDLDSMAEEAKKQTKTIAVTLPVEEAERVQKLADKLRKKEQKASKKLKKYLMPQPKKNRTNPIQEPQVTQGLTKVEVISGTPSLKQQRDIEFAKAVSQYSLSEMQIRRLEVLMKQKPDSPIKELAEQVQKEMSPQIMVIEVAPKVYSALEEFAISEKLLIKEVAIVLIEEGLERHGFWKRMISS